MYNSSKSYDLFQFLHFGRSCLKEDINLVKKIRIIFWKQKKKSIFLKTQCLVEVCALRVLSSFFLFFFLLSFFRVSVGVHVRGCGMRPACAACGKKFNCLSVGVHVHGCGMRLAGAACGKKFNCYSVGVHVRGCGMRLADAACL